MVGLREDDLAWLWCRFCVLVGYDRSLAMFRKLWTGTKNGSTVERLLRL